VALLGDGDEADDLIAVACHEHRARLGRRVIEVEEVVVPQLAADIAAVATAAVRDLLEAEQAAPSGPVHGDLTPCDLLCHNGVVTGIIDWDAAGTLR
jgi:aminoglycoside phosphotransferase (APT) family kinase protein